MGRLNLWFFNLAVTLAVMFIVPAVTAQAGGGKNSGSSEVIVQRVDNNSLIRLRIYIDARVAGSLKVGETVAYKIPNGPHTIRAAFEDYQARSTEITQFTLNNSRIMFTVTDESIVAVSQESTRTVSLNESNTANMESSVRNAFENATKPIKRKSKVAVINVDSDNLSHADYILEELIYLTVQSPKRLEVIDRRTVDAFRATSGVGVPSYNNDYLLWFIGQLLGADFVISGRLDGQGELRRLRVKTIDVRTGRLVGNSSEPV
jgi:TolB-like protein